MKKLYILSLLFILQVSIFPQAFKWEWQNSKPVGNDLNDITALSSTRVLAFGLAGTVLISTNNGETWTLTYADNSRRDIWNSYFLNPTTGFICGEGGLIMKTTDGGDSWIEKNSTTTNVLYDIEFLNADTGIAVGGTGTVLRTFNGGETWSSTSLGTSSHYKVSIINSTTIFAGGALSTARLNKSTDFGNTWTNVTPAAVTSSVYGMYKKDASTFFLTTGSNGILMSTDAGATWTVQQAVATIVYDVRFINATTGFASDSKGIIYMSTNSGVAWAPTQSSSNKAIRAVGYNAATVFLCGNSGNLFKSTDNGVSWAAKHTTVSQDFLRRMTFKSSSTGYICGGSSTAADSLGYILKTTNGGLSWERLPYNFKSQVYSFSMPTANTWYVGRGANGFFKSTDAGATFNAVATPITSTTHVFWFTGFLTEQKGITGGTSGKVLKTTDGGASWTDISTAAGFGTNVVYEISIIDTNTFYLAGLGGRLAKTTDGGTTFTAMTLPIGGSFFTVKFKNANVGMVAGGSLAAAVTTNGGTTWTQSTFPAGLVSSTSLWSVAYSDSGYIWISSINGDILYSTDGGLNFVATKKPTSYTIFGLDIVGNNMWAAGSGGVIIKGGSSPYLPVELTSFTADAVNKSVVLKWSTASENNNKGFDIERQTTAGIWNKIGFVSGKGTTVGKSSYAFTDNSPAGRNIYRLKQIDFDGTFSYSKTAEVNFEAPVKFELVQNYPNPFNPVTSIKYSIPMKSNVELKVFNILGKEIITLVNEVKDAGSYSVDFNASNLSSGVYFYKISAGQFNSVRKMILLK